MVESPKGFHQLALSDVSKPKLSCSVKGKGFFPEIHQIEWVGTYWNGSKGWLRLNSSYLFAEKGFQIVDMYLNLKIVASSSDFKVRHRFHFVFSVLVLRTSLRHFVSSLILKRVWIDVGDRCW